MNKLVLSFLSILMALGMVSCRSKKPATTDDYYSNPRANTATLTRKAREESRVEAASRLSDNGKLRAFGQANDFNLNDARRDAIRAAQTELAMQIENAIAITTQEFRKKSNINTKKLSERQLNEIIETNVVQVVKNTHVVDFQAYDVTDGTIDYEVCIEMSANLNDVLGTIGDQLSHDEVLAIDYDKQQFIKENKERIEQNRSRLYENLGK